MTKKIVKRTDANNEILYFYTHSDAVDVGEGNNTTSLTAALNSKANASDLQALSDDALRKSPQSLSSQEKSQVHNNIGTESFVDDRAVRYDEYQVLGSDEKELALVNLGLNGVDAEPTKNSQKMVRSGGVAEAIDNVQYARFDGIQETSVTLNTTTTATGNGSVLFYVPNNAFIYKVGNTYYTLWNNTNRLTNGFYNDGESTPHALTTKIFINTTNGLPYSFDGTNFTTVAIDEDPTAGSDNLVKSGGVKESIQEVTNILTGEQKDRLIVNGSQGNSGNAWVVTIRGKETLAIPVKEGHKYEVTINKPSVDGFNYYFRIMTYNTSSPTSLNGNAIRNQVSNWNNYYTVEDNVITINSGEKGLSIQLTELTSAGEAQTASTCIPLRATDFSENDIIIKDISSGVIRDIEEIRTSLANLDSDVDEIKEWAFNGYFVGAANTYKSTEIKTLVPNRKYRVIIINPDYDRGEVTVTGAFIFGVYSYYNNVATKLFGVATTGTIPDSFDIEIPNNSDYVTIGGRASNGVEVKFYIYDITGLVQPYISFLYNIPWYNSNVLSAFYFEQSYRQNGSVYFKIGASGITLRYGEGNSFQTPLSTTSIASDLEKEKITSPKGESNCLEIQHNQALYFDVNNTKFVLFNLVAQVDEHRYIRFFGVSHGSLIKTGEIILPYIDKNTNLSIDGIYSGLTGKVTEFRNGSPSNPTNVNVVTSAGIPHIDGKKYITITTNRPNTEGYRYVYGGMISKRINDIGVVSMVTSGVSTVVADINITSFANTITIPDNRLDYNTIFIAIGESNGTTLNPLRVADFDGYDVIVRQHNNVSEAPIVSRNTDKLPMLINSCRFNKNSIGSKDFQVLICTDSHAWGLANKNAIDAANGFNVVDAYVHCGDIVAGNYSETTAIAAFQEQFNSLTKPGYIVCGNHDVGNCYYVGLACNHQQAYESWIKPMVDNGWLSNGEYEGGKPYWFHDNTTYKIRLIGLYEYDDNLDLNETYWKAIEYDSAVSNLALNTAYSVGNKVNVPNYTDFSFECVQAVTTPSSYLTTPEKLPSYKVQRGMRVIRQTQAQWFLNTLASTPANYGVIVIMHNPFSDTATSLDKKFSWPSGVQGSSFTQSNMATNFICNALKAFKAGENYSEKVIMKSNASYLNVLNDGNVNYAYEVSKDFRNKNAGVALLGLLGGHSHRDIIWKETPNNIYQIAPNCARVDGANDKNGDVRRTQTDGIAADSLTVVSFANDRIGLVKLGVNVTERGTMRDFEVIDTTN